MSARPTTAAIGRFGLDAGAALATVVGVPIAVPVTRLAARLANRSRRWHAAGAAVQSRRRARGCAAS